MSATLCGVLDTAAPFMHPALVSDASLERLRQYALRLPPSCMAGLEVRLHADQPVVDLFTRLRPGVDAVPSQWLEHPAWSAIASCLGPPRAQLPSAVQAISRIDLEFDLDAPPPQVLLPSLFLSLVDESAPTRARLGLPPADLLFLTEKLAGFAPSAQMTRTVQRCCQLLPSSGIVQYLGLMARGGEFLRLAIGGLRLEQLATYLQQIAWAGDLARLSAAVDTWRDLIQPVVILHLDIGAQLMTKIGVEIYAQPAPASVQWQRVLDALCDQGLCSVDKRAALSHWLSADPRASFDRKPATLSGEDYSGFFLWKLINHIKLVSHGADFVEAKAYLGFGRKPVKPVVAAVYAGEHGELLEEGRPS